MKKYSVIGLLFLLIVGCNKSVLDKPNNLVEKDKMEDILYDLALLEAMKSQNLPSQNYPKPIEYVKNKYGIDSITFAKSSKYYASDIRNYKKMYENVKNRLDEDKKKAAAK